MASAESVDDLVGQPLFLEMVKAIYEAAAGTQLRQGHELNANLALNALSFISAMLQEADPDYADDDSLSLASARASADQLAFLTFLRDHSRETGKHMLEGMAAGQVVSAQPSAEEDSQFSRLVNDLQMAIINASSPRNFQMSDQGETGAFVALDLPTVAQALTYVIGSFAAQSGDIQSLKARRLFADALRDNFLSAFKEVERQMAVLKAAPIEPGKGPTTH